MDVLIANVDRVVEDKTALTGAYDFELKWTPAEMQSSSDAGPAIFTALQEQLGLKLEATKADVDIIMVDSIERPSAN